MFILTKNRLIAALSMGLGYLMFASPVAYGQSGLTVSALRIHSKVEAVNNWSPPTAISRQNQFEGTSTGYGANLNYSFRPAFLIRNPRILLNVGAGYFSQRFDMQRPFDYDSPLFPTFYTDHYAYRCWQWSAGATYSHPLNEKYFLSGNLSYTWLHSFRQEYTPVSNHGYGGFTQTNRRPTDFGNMLMLAIGINRNMGGRFVFGLNAIIPLYTRWRNDRIFRDDPTKFSHPGLSLGLSADVTYRLKKNTNPTTPKP